MPRPATRNGRAEDRVFNAITRRGARPPPCAGHPAQGTRAAPRLPRQPRRGARAALTRLGHSLLVELRPNRGAIIANPIAAETRDMFEARRVHRGERSCSAWRARSPRSRSPSCELRRRGGARVQKGERKAGQRLSIRFHKVLSELAGNATLDRFMEHLICRTPLLASRAPDASPTAAPTSTATSSSRARAGANRRSRVARHDAAPRTTSKRQLVG